MSSLINALSSFIPGLNSDLLIGVHFHPSNEEGIRIVKMKNAGWQLLPIFNEYDYLFQRPPEELEECYCFTKVKPLGKNKVDRTLGDGSGFFWKNTAKPEVVTDCNKKRIGYVTKLVLHEDKNTKTEWHILEYRDTELADAGRYVLCQIYKHEKNKDSGSEAKKTMLSSMASHRYAFSSLNPELKSDGFIGFPVAPTNEELISIVNKKNAGDEVHPMFKGDEDLFQRPPEQLEECYCFTKLMPVAKDKANRQLSDCYGRHWKNTKQEKVEVNNVIGRVTQLVLHWNKKTPTEWHMTEYRDTERPVAGRYVLCHVYKLEKKNDSGRGDENQAQCSNTNPEDQIHGADQSFDVGLEDWFNDFHSYNDVWTGADWINQVLLKSDKS